MKRLHNYILLSVLAFVLASCSEDEVIDNNGQNHVAGDILFSLSLPEASSRTVYGDEDKDKNVFPIYWVNGDKVQIFSPQGLEGRRNAEYQVAVTKTNQNYADDLTKTGAYGVQWGDGKDKNGNVILYDFYSLYPSGNYTLSTDGTKAENITINSMQNIVVNDGVVKSDMEDCLMYAKTTGVKKGETVNLQYNPITTVLMVKVKVAANETGTDPDNFTIQSIKLEADTEIAGTFSLNISDGSFGKFTKDKASKIVQADIVNNITGGYHSISNGESFEIPLFLAPTFTVNEDGTVKEGPNVKNWKISIDANNNTYTKTLNIEKALTPGQIHKITLPELKPATTEWVVSKWMTYIPRNVYLSEVSIPGSWNSLNPEFQGANPTISGQYANGARAFHLDTRWQGESKGFLQGYKVNNVLGVADGGETNEYQSDARIMIESDNPSVEDALDEIIDNIQTDEYMVLMCTFAQGSYNHSYISNDVTYDWAGEISRICSIKDEVYDAKDLTPNTLVGDVLGKVIVIVNMEGAFTSLPSDSKCLFVNSPLKLTSNLFGAELSNINKTDIMKGTASATDVSDTFIDIYHTQAQVCISDSYTTSQSRDNVDGRGFAPTFSERKTVANNILDWSKDNYGTDNYAHDKWIYLGLGGYYMEYKRGSGLDLITKWRAATDGHEDVASDCNTWINGKITEMGTIPNGQKNLIPYYPVGIVLMNFTNDYASTVKNILLLNNKYRLQFDPNKPSNYDPNNKNQDDFDGTFEEETDDEDPFA